MQIFNSQKKIKKVSYQYVPSKSVGAIQLMEDYEFNPIPRVGEIVIVSSAMYSVVNVIYDFDKEMIVVMLKFRANVNDGKEE